MLSVGILGPVEVRRDGVRLTIPAGKTTEVLVRLALEAGVAVRADRLIEDLWSEQAMGVAGTPCNRRCRDCAGHWATRG